MQNVKLLQSVQCDHGTNSIGLFCILGTRGYFDKYLSVKSKKR